MLNLKETSPLKMLRQFAVYFDGDLTENLGAAKLKINNKKGKGEINLYELFPGLTAWVYNIEFYEDFVIKMSFAEENPYYFGYPLEGEQLQKFPNEKNYKKIKQGQNFIIVGEPKSSSEFITPANTNFECCFLIVNSKKFNNVKDSLKTRLKIDLNEIFDDSVTEKPYRYFGNIDVRTGLFAKIVTKNKRTDLVGRLLTEGAVLNMLASQIEAHDYDLKAKSFHPELSLEELNKLSDIGDFVKENLAGKITIADISKETGLSAKKLQSGFKFLYGYSVNLYIANIKLERAKELIYNTDKSISEVCYEVGYSSRSYFSKIFQERFGVLPSEYKNSIIQNDMVFEVSYRSMAFEGITENDLKYILETSRKTNKEFDITGSLIYHRNVFFQIIEGPKSNILNLYENIKNDNRHFDVQTLWQGVKKSREFTDWDMAALTDKHILDIETQGSTKSLNLGHLMGNVDGQTLMSQNLWKKVRTIIQTESQLKQIK